METLSDIVITLAAGWQLKTLKAGFMSLNGYVQITILQHQFAIVYTIPEKSISVK